jgi:bacteriophage exclusion system BrxA-like protein
MSPRNLAKPGKPPVVILSKARVRLTPETRPEGRPLTFEPSVDMLRTGLESAGLQVGDTIAVLERLAVGVGQQEIAARIAEGSLLHKRTVHGRRHLLAAVRRRYVAPPDPLQGPVPLAAALRAVRSPIARSQILLPYLLLSDRGAFEVTSGLVLPRMAARGVLRKLDVIAALDAVLERHGRGPWSPALRTRWAEGLLSVLRDVGALGRGNRRERLLPYDVRPEAFCFHLWGLYGVGVRGDSLYNTPFWRLLLLSAAEARTMLTVVGSRGWWRVRTLTSVVEAVPAADSLMEWLRHGLG